MRNVVGGAVRFRVPPMAAKFRNQSLVPFLTLFATACGGGGGSTAPVTPTLVFGAPQLIGTGGANARSLAIADLDHDGIADVVVANETFASISVLKGQASGSLATGVLVPAPSLVASLAVGNVDGDRVLDLVAASGASTQATWSRGVGDGTFAAAVGITMPWACRKVALIDWNADGNTDLIAASAQTAEIALLLGDGTGNFPLSQVVATLFAPADFVVADLNADALPDLAYTGAAALNIAALRNDGLGGFLPAVTSAVQAQGGRLVVGDVNRDLIVDLVGTSSTGDRFFVYLGNGAGAFTKAAEREVAGVSINGLALGDLDGDGKVDVLATATNQLLVSYGDGAGAFGAAESLHTDSLGATWVAASDLVGDSTIDVFYVSGSNRIGVLRNPRLAPVGLLAYGQGTPDCGGRISMWANGSPRVGNSSYGYLTTNAPPSSVGIALQGGPADAAGSDPLGIGALIHVGFGLVTTKLVFSDPQGNCFFAEPVPAVPGLVGLPIYVQTLWQADLSSTCSTSAGGYVSSVGLTSTIQP